MTRTLVFSSLSVCVPLQNTLSLHSQQDLFQEIKAHK